jgi:subtilisin family serine protease
MSTLSRDYIVLRAESGQWKFRGSETRMHAALPEMATISVDVERLDGLRLGEARNDPAVLHVAPPVPMQLIAPLSSESGEESQSGDSAWGIEAVGATQSRYTGRGIVVALLDTGIDANHEAFTDVELLQRDFTGEGDGDRNGHGTHCAGTIFGRQIGAVRCGVGIGVQKALIGKVLDRHGAGSSDAVCRAILWAMENGAHIVSLSLGMDFPAYVRDLTDQGYPVDLAMSKALEGYRANTRLFDKLMGYAAARNAFGHGALLVAAAGNESRRKRDPGHTITASPPAAADGVIAVAAIGKLSNVARPFHIADFSNTGAQISAPGIGIFSAKAGGGSMCLSGTSMAAPHVAGVATLWAEMLLQENHIVDAEIVTSRLVGCARSLPGLRMLDVGSGLVQAPRG